MELRDNTNINYNEDHAFQAIGLGSSTLLPIMAMQRTLNTEIDGTTVGITTGIITTTASTAASNIDAPHLNVYDNMDLLTIKREDYRKLYNENPSQFRFQTEQFLTEMLKDISELELNQEFKEDIVQSANICKQVGNHLRELMEVVDNDEIATQERTLDQSVTDFKLRFEVVISMTDAILSKCEQQSRVTRKNLLQRLTRCPTPIAEMRTSSRVQNENNIHPATINNHTSLNYTTLGQPSRFTSNPLFTQPGIRDDAGQNRSVPPGPNTRLPDMDDDNESISSSYSIQDTLSELTFDGSWRLINYTGCDLAAITIHSAMMQIAAITKTEVNQHTDECTLKALDSRDVPQLKDWQKIINKNILTLPNIEEFKELRIHAGHALKAAFKYIATVDHIIRERGLHIKSDNTTASPLELKRFDGYESKDTNVFEFLTQLALVCRGMHQNEIAEYLYCNYLTTRLQQELKHIRHSFLDMRSFLIKRYGRINRLLRENKTQLRELIPPTGKTPKPAKVMYLNRIVELLQQMQSLVEHNKVDKPGIQHEIYNYDTIMDFVSYIAEPFKSGYLGEYVKVSSTSYGDEDLPGVQIFKLLLKYIKSQVRKIELNIATTLLVTQDPERKQIQTKTVNALEIADIEDISDVDETTDPIQVNVAGLHPTNDKSQKKKWVDDGKWHQATCFMHDATYNRVRDCPMGKCKTFLNATAGERNKKADEKSRCKLCFMRKCKRNDPNKCMFKDAIGQSLICKACLIEGNHKSILLCENHDSSTCVIKSELVDHLAGYQEDIAINLMTLSILKLSKGKPGDVLVKDQSRKNNCAYNVTDGSSINKHDILHKITKDRGLESPLYLLQTLNVGGVPTLCMFDTGAGGEVCTTELAEKLKLEVIDPREQFIRVASGKVVPTGGCVYNTTLGPDPEGCYHEVSLTGMSRITGKINHCNLSEIIKEFKINQASTPLSKECVPPYIGGTEVGLIIGVKQSCLMPDLLMVLPSGISVWRSRLKDVHGSSLMFSGLHQSISTPAKPSDKEPTPINIMFSQEANSYLYEFQENVSLACIDHKIAPQILQFVKKGSECYIDSPKPLVTPCTCNNPITINAFQCCCYTPDNEDDDAMEDSKLNDLDDSLENQETHSSLKTTKLETSQVSVMKFKTKAPKRVEQSLAQDEEIGAKVDYRCNSCQGCLTCKTARRTRDVSIREIEEEYLIKASVKVDTETNTTWAKYPFIRDPDSFLKEKWNGRDNNYFMALRSLNTVRNKPKVEKEGIINFHKELLEKNYAIKVSDLPVKVQDQIHNAPLRHYFPWKGIQKPGSSSTKYRMVCDPTITEFNSVLAKGQNCLNSLFEIVVEWRTYRHSATSDISKMFNSLKLEESEYRYSLYLFSPNLELGENPDLYAMITVMYGLKCAANQCTSGLRDTAEEFKIECPRANTILLDSTYMDDSGFGANTKQELREIIEEIKTVLPRGGFKLKTVNVSGEDPDESASNDGIHTSFAGYQWSQRLDLLSLNHGEINFHKKLRGYKQPNASIIETDDDLENLVKTQKFTRRNLMGKTLEVYDLCGIAEPLKAKLKIDVRKLVDLDYDADLPINLRKHWILNLKLIQNSRSLTWLRSVVPDEAVNPDEFELVCFVDAATDMAGTAIYTRFLCKDGSYQSQLLTARSKCVNSTIPRNELCSALLGAQTLHIVMNRLGNRVKDYIVLTDSEICLFWITNPENRLKSYVFNRVRNIHRLIDKDQFYHVRTLDNSADILTRGEVELRDLDIGSLWQTGPDWLKLPISEMPVRSPEVIRQSLTREQEAHISRESQPKLDEEKLFPSVPKMCASFSSTGHICCHNFDISLDCHCYEDTKCCLCVYDPALLEIDLEEIEYPDENTDKPHYSVIHINPEKRDMLTDILELKYYGFQKSLRLIGLLFRFITRTMHAVHIKKQTTNLKCRLCNSDETIKRNSMHRLTVKNNFIPTAYEIHLAWDLLCRKATNEVRANASNKKLLAYEEENGILVSGGRLTYPDVLVDSPELPYFPDLNFKSPVALVRSNLVTSLAIYIHWNVLPHVGVDQQLSFMLKIVHVENLRFLIKRVRNECPRCRYLLKQSPAASTGNQSKLAMLKAPAFYAAMIDIAGPFDSFSLVRQVKDKRKRKAYMLIFVCLTSSATNIHCIEDMTTESIVSAILRHSNRYGIAQFLIADNQSSFVTLKQARIQFQDLQGHVWKDKRIILDFSTPLHHAGHGKVEVRVRLIREMLDSTSESSKEKSYLMWETVASTISNMLNNMPIAHCSDQNGVDDPIFLVTPNSLILGKNQNRSVAGPIELEDCYVNSQFTNVNELTELVQSQIARMAHKYVPGRKVSTASPPLIGEIILFVMKENQRSRNVIYKYGRVTQNYVDGRENKIRIRYKNSTESVYREVYRHVNEIVVILSLQDLQFETVHQQLLHDLKSKYL